jgi:hypothetical protein
LEKEYKGSPSTTLDQVIEGFVNEFKDLRISKTAIHRFMTEKCALSSKRHIFILKKETSVKALGRDMTGVKDGMRLAWISKPIVRFLISLLLI